jgi:hypothetical protein
MLYEMKDDKIYNKLRKTEMVVPKFKVLLRSLPGVGEKMEGNPGRIVCISAEISTQALSKFTFG